MRDLQASHNDSRRQIRQLKEELHGLLTRMRADEPHTGDPQALALMETAAEVISGLVRACEGYELGHPARPQPENAAEAATAARQASRQASGWTDHLEAIPPGRPD